MTFGHYEQDNDKSNGSEPIEWVVIESNGDEVTLLSRYCLDSIIKGFDPKPVSASGYRAASCSLNAGGEAVNEAMAASKLGVKTGILCSLGEDGAGDMVAGALKGCGVDTSLIVRSADHPTPVTTMFVGDDGTRQSITNRSHTYNFHPERYSSGFSGARALILGSLFRAPFDDPEVIRRLIRAAKEIPEPLTTNRFGCFCSDHR